MKSLCILLPLLFCLNSTPNTSKVPSSTRATAAVKKYTSSLKKAFSAKQLTWGSPVYLRIFKLEKRLEVWVKHGSTYILFKQYPICYFAGKLGPKLKQGDLQAPEGFYYVTPEKMNPWSVFHLSFNIGYPNTYDRANQRTGGLIMVHGGCASLGCFAIQDHQVSELWVLLKSAFDQGQPFFRVHIFPFEMHDKNMTAFKASPWHTFWENLKTGYDWFETHGTPPNVTVKNKRYTFSKA